MTAAIRLSPGCPLGFPVARLLPHFLAGTLARPGEDLECRQGESPGREAVGATRSPAGTRTWKRPCTDAYRDRITHSGRSD